jgi:hypothetical protein
VCQCLLACQWWLQVLSGRGSGEGGEGGGSGDSGGSDGSAGSGGSGGSKTEKCWPCGQQKQMEGPPSPPPAGAEDQAHLDAMKFLISLDELQAVIQLAHAACKEGGRVPEATRVGARSVQLVFSDTQKVVPVITPRHYYAMRCRQEEEKEKRSKRKQHRSNDKHDRKTSTLHRQKMRHTELD